MLLYYIIMFRNMSILVGIFLVIQMEEQAIDNHLVSNLLEMIERVLNTSTEGVYSASKEHDTNVCLQENPLLADVGRSSSPHFDGTSVRGLLPTPVNVLGSMNCDTKKGNHTPQWELQAPHNTMTLPDISKLLDFENHTRVICVKKIHKLGFRSARYLRQYFSHFGQIAKLILLPSRQKDGSAYHGFGSPVRPASMCFIVMTSEDSVRHALMQELHFIGEYPVEVAPYTPSCLNHGGVSNMELRGRSSSLSSFETDVSC